MVTKLEKMKALMEGRRFKVETHEIVYFDIEESNPFRYLYDGKDSEPIKEAWEGDWEEIIEKPWEPSFNEMVLCRNSDIHPWACGNYAFTYTGGYTKISNSLIGGLAFNTIASFNHAKLGKV